MMKQYTDMMSDTTGQRIADQLEKLNEPTPSIIEKEVDSWLKEHPEASTTVQDGSIEEQKIHPSFLPFIKKDYVTPQMFGAVGDGVHDDTEAFQRAFNTKKVLHILNGHYKITKSLNAYNSIFADKEAIIEFYTDVYGEACINISGHSERIFEKVDCTITDKILTIKEDNISQISAKDYIYISNDELASTYGREYDTKRDILQIDNISDNKITLNSSPVYDYTNLSIDLMHLISGIIIDGLKIECKNKTDYTVGILLKYCESSVIKNCNIKGFDYAGIEFQFCTFCNAHSNYCEIDYTDQLQYGIIITSSSNISIYGNNINSKRTAIDATRLSNKITITNNATVGNINTHSASNIVISGNTINEGMINIRGKNVIVTNNSVENHSLFCIEIEEMGIDGGHLISDNIFKGYCSMKAWQSDISIINNKFIVDKVMQYGSSLEYESVIRIMNKTSQEKRGITISGNTFDYIGNKPPRYCIECLSGLNSCYNVIVTNNVINNFEVGLNLAQRSAIIGDNLIVKNNLLKVTQSGIWFRLTNNAQIINNTIICTNNESGTYGVWRYDIANISVQGLIIRDNYIKNFDIGFKYGGNGYTFDVNYSNNIFEDVNTIDTNLSGTISRISDELFLKSPSGSIYKISIDDAGKLNTALQIAPSV